MNSEPQAVAIFSTVFRSHCQVVEHFILQWTRLLPDHAFDFLNTSLIASQGMKKNTITNALINPIPL